MVLADGCFDPLHWGHVRYLQAASAFGPVVVRIAPDAAILAKGRPVFQPQGERAQMIRAFASVDSVIVDVNLAQAIRRIRPMYFVKGADWEGRLPFDVTDACAVVGTQIVYVPTQERTSTERLAG